MLALTSSRRSPSEIDSGEATAALRALIEFGAAQTAAHIIATLRGGDLQTAAALQELARTLGATIVITAEDPLEDAVAAARSLGVQGAKIAVEAITAVLEKHPELCGTLLDKLHGHPEDGARIVRGFHAALARRPHLTRAQVRRLGVWNAELLKRDVSAFAQMDVTKRAHDYGRKTLVYLSHVVFYADPCAALKACLTHAPADIVCDDVVASMALAAATHENGSLNIIQPYVYDASIDRDIAYAVVMDLMRAARPGYEQRCAERLEGFEIPFEDMLSACYDDVYVAVAGLERARHDVSRAYRRIARLEESSQGIDPLDGFVLTRKGRATIRPTFARVTTLLSAPSDMRPAADALSGVDDAAPDGLDRRDVAMARPNAADPGFFTPLSTTTLRLGDGPVYVIFAEIRSAPYANSLAILLEHLPDDMNLLVVAPYYPATGEDAFIAAVIALARRRAPGHMDDTERVRRALPRVQFVYLDFQVEGDSQPIRAAATRQEPAAHFLTETFAERLKTLYGSALAESCVAALRDLVRVSIRRALYARLMARSLLDEIGPRLGGITTFSNRYGDARIAARMARGRGAPVVDWQVVLLSRSPVFLPLVADRALAINNVAARLYVDHFGLPARCVWTIGFLRLARALGRDNGAAGEVILRREALDGGTSFHIFAAQPLAREDQARLLRILAAAAQKTARPILICPHPTQNENGDLGWLTDVVGEIGDDLLRIRPDFSAYALLRQAQSVIAYSSNVIFEAASVGRRAILLDALSTRHILDHTYVANISVAMDADDLALRMMDAEQDAQAHRDIEFAMLERRICARIVEGMREWPRRFRAPTAQALERSEQLEAQALAVQKAAHAGSPDPGAWAQAALAWTRAGQGARAAETLKSLLSSEAADASLARAVCDRLMENGAANGLTPALRRLAEFDPTDTARLGRGLRALRAAGLTCEAETVAASIAKPRPNPLYASKFVGPLAHMSAYYDGSAITAALPYQMLAPAAHVASDTFNTDALGYRYTLTSAGERFSPADDKRHLGDSAMIGNSAVFGVGSTSDATTLPSLMSNGTRRYYNFGMRAASAMQNYVAFSQWIGEGNRVAEIKLVAGWIEFASVMRIDVTPRRFAPYMTWSHVDSVLNARIRALPWEDWPAAAAAHFASPFLDEPARVRLVCEQIGACVGAFTALARGIGARFTFVLQPIAEWISREPPKEELHVASILRDAPDQEPDLHRFSLAHYKAFATALESECCRAGARFIDGSALLGASSNRNGWLFAGRAHLTDHGAELLAAALRRH